MRNGLELNYWHATPVEGSSNPHAVTHDVKNLLPLITQNTRIVAITACSNILGSIVDVRSVVKQVCNAFRIVCGENDRQPGGIDSRESR